MTDATTLQARWTLTSSRLAMPHMPATGVSGLDLYAKADEGRWRWLAVGQPREHPDQYRDAGSGLPEGRREYLLYLPLYNGVSSLEIGVPGRPDHRQARAAGSRTVASRSSSTGLRSRRGAAPRVRAWSTRRSSAGGSIAR